MLSGAPRVEHNLIKAGRRPSIIEGGIVEQGTAGLSDSNFTPAGRGGAVFVTVENGQIRPDEPITHAEMAAALSALYVELSE